MDQIRRLRVASGAPIADCKAALSDSEVAGDIDKAFQWLRKKGKAAASRMAGRDAKEGLIGVRVNGKVGTIVEVNSETDFVARNERFAEFVDTVAESSIALSNAGGQIEVADLLASSVPGGGGIVSDALGDTVSVIRENVSIGRAASVECDEGGVVGAYVHAGGKAAALVALNGAGADANQLELAARRLAMHCVAAKPLYLSESDVPPAAIEREKKILVSWGFALERERLLANALPD
jgi:elongation factor Ts